MLMKNASFLGEAFLFYFDKRGTAIEPEYFWKLTVRWWKALLVQLELWFSIDQRPEHWKHRVMSLKRL